MANAKLVIDIVANSADATAGLDKTAASASKMQNGIHKAAGVAAAGLLAVAAAAADCVKAASDQQQAFGGLEAVFGDSSDQMKQWANTAADTMGMSATAYAEGAAKIGAQFKNMGVPMDQVAGKTNDLMVLASDLAATYGGETSEAVAALGAAMRGEADPAERYGLSLSQTAVAARMAADGTNKLTGTALQQAKAQTMLTMATEQAGGAIGQFAAESDSAAGSAQIAAANFENAKAALGESLLPALTAAAQALAGLAGFIQQNSTAVTIFIGALSGLAALVIATSGALKLMALAEVALGIATATTTGMTIAQRVAAIASAIAANAVAVATGVWTAAQWLLNAALTANPIGIVIAAIVALIAIIVIAWNKSDAFRNAVMQLWNAIKTGSKAAVAALRSAFSTVWTWLKAQATAVTNAIKSAFSSIAGPIRAVTNAIRSAFNAVFNFLKSAARSVSSAIRSAFNAIAGPIVAVANKIKSAFVSAFNALKSAARGVGSAVMAPFRAIAGAVNSAIGAVKSLIGWLSRIRMPSIKIPSGFSVAPAAGAPTVTSAGNPRLTATTRASSTTAAGGVVINVNGALDPDGVARQIERILGGAQRRRQGVTLRSRAGSRATPMLV